MTMHFVLNMIVLTEFYCVQLYSNFDKCWTNTTLHTLSHTHTLSLTFSFFLLLLLSLFLILSFCFFISLSYSRTQTKAGHLNRCQFHQRFTWNFFHESVLCSFSLVTVWLCTFFCKRILAKKLLLKCWWYWLLISVTTFLLKKGKTVKIAVKKQ